METSLLSSEGFPRSDLDVVEVRTTRVKIIKLKNDLKYLLEELSERLTQQFQRTPTAQTQQRQQSSVPFAIITEVVVNSPAERSVCSMLLYCSSESY
jgi:26S proteasome non-ATPase regulatory subunit 9